MEELGKSHLMDEDFHKGRTFEDETCTMDEKSIIKIAPWMKYYGIFFPKWTWKVFLFFCIMNENVHWMDEKFKMKGENMKI